MILAFDPGKNIGVALVTPDGRLIKRHIIHLNQLRTLELVPDAKIVVGDGTGSAAVQAVLTERGYTFELVDETNTSLEAKVLYLQQHPPKGVWRLLPRGLYHPPGVIDDFAAYAIALRYLNLHPE